jgi:ribosomal protein S18 acetylase RimI-like enzyme
VQKTLIKILLLGVDNVIQQEVRIKSFEREDKESLKGFAKLINQQDELEISISERVFEYILAQPHLRENTMLAYHNDELIAFAACIKNSKDGDEANFELVIHPGYRHKGLGKMLYDIIFEKSRALSVKKVTAFAKEHMEHSVKFLQSRDFRIHKYMWKMDYDLQDTVYKAIPLDEYSIEQLTTEHIDDYVDIMNAGFKKEGDILYNENSFQMLLSNPDEYVFFIKHRDRIAATAAIGFQRDIDRGYIHNVTVYSDYRGKGLGEMALNHCINIVKEANLSKAALNVDGENKNALGLYKKIGFEESNTDIIFKLNII